MKKIIELFISSVSILICSAVIARDINSRYSIKDVQGAWWTNCGAPSADFVVEKNVYYGDFVGDHTLTFKDNILIFTHGFPENHEIHVSGKPKKFKILHASQSELLLRAVEGSTSVDWHLFSCRGLPP